MKGFNIRLVVDGLYSLHGGFFSKEVISKNENRFIYEGREGEDAGEEYLGDYIFRGVTTGEHQWVSPDWEAPVDIIQVIAIPDPMPTRPGAGKHITREADLILGATYHLKGGIFGHYVLEDNNGLFTYTNHTGEFAVFRGVKTGVEQWWKESNTPEQAEVYFVSAEAKQKKTKRVKGPKRQPQTVSRALITYTDLSTYTVKGFSSVRITPKEINFTTKDEQLAPGIDICEIVTVDALEVLNMEVYGVNNQFEVAFGASYLVFKNKFGGCETTDIVQDV